MLKAYDAFAYQMFKHMLHSKATKPIQQQSVLIALTYHSIGYEDGLRAIDYLLLHEVFVELYIDKQIIHPADQRKLEQRFGLPIADIHHLKQRKSLQEQIIFAPVMPPAQLVKICNYDDATIFSSIIVDAMLRGISICSLSHACDTYSSAWYIAGYEPNRHIKDDLQKKLMRASQLGIFFAHDNNELLRFLKADKYTTFTKPRLLTERDICYLFDAGVRSIVNDSSCMLTPLAKDKARELNITIVKK